tara:strand:- start:3995 stop:5389 length:1395 start_codon:yes stop_codon:yes gene_type:complete
MTDKKKLIPSLPNGFQDSWGNTLILKKRLLKIIEENFIKFGFSPLETSPMEYSSLIGNSLAEDETNPMADIFTFNDNGIDISLRYDLSVPLARFYSQNYLNLPNPYKRFQIGTVFRREKPGNGRYKSFDQCDCDIIGKFDIRQANSELINLIGSTLTSCGLKKSDFKINVSNRKIVQGLMEELKIVDEKQKKKVLRAIDKLDKPGFGIKGVEELLKKERRDSSGAVTKGANLKDNQAQQIIDFLKIRDLKDISKKFDNPLIKEGIKELEDLFKILNYGDFADLVKFDPSKIRGLDIYTGFIVETNLNFEVKNSKGKIIDPGSICSGGEYLVTKYKGEPFLGTGISIGISRLVWCLLQKIKDEIEEQKPVLVCIMDEKYLDKYYELLNILRKNGINSEIFLESSKKLSKQLEYANRRGLNLTLICGENEFKENQITLKNLQGSKGKNQITIPKENLINEIKKLIK